MERARRGQKITYSCFLPRAAVRECCTADTSLGSQVAGAHASSGSQAAGAAFHMVQPGAGVVFGVSCMQDLHRTDDREIAAWTKNILPLRPCQLVLMSMLIYSAQSSTGFNCSKLYMLLFPLTLWECCLSSLSQLI